MSRNKLRPLALFVALAALGAAACTGEFEFTEPAGSTGVGTPDAGTVGSAAGRAFFQANVQPLLSADRPKGTCAFCHQEGLGGTGPFFMGASAAAHYEALVANTRLVGATPDASLFVTRGDHTGDAFCTGAGVPYAACQTDEISILNEWIGLEAP